MLPRTLNGGAIHVSQTENACNESYSRGIDLYDQGLYTEAIAEFEHVLKTVPAADAPERKLASFYMGESYANLGLAHLHMRMYYRAEEELKFALLLHPQYADLNFHLGVANYKRGKFADSRLLFEKAISINPAYFKAMMYLGLSRLMQEDAGGMKHIHDVVEAQPAYADARYYQAVKAWDSGDVRQAVTLLEDLVETDVDASTQLLEKGLEYLRESMFPEAAGVLREAVALHPHFADLRNYLGQSYLWQDMIDQAIGQFQKAIEINPDFVGAHMNLASAYERDGRIDEARSELTRVLKINTRNPEAEERLYRLQPAA
jgi:tetratricopeptide (TPR) repeat protein